MGKPRHIRSSRTLHSKRKPQFIEQTCSKNADMNWIQKFFRKNSYTNQSSQYTNQSVIYKSELEYIKKCIMDCPRIETGGQLFGFWTPQGRPVVLYAIGPGPRAGHHYAFFEQDVDYLDIVGNAIVKNFGLCHIGEWHSHHQLGLAQPSGHDASNIQNNVDKLRLNHFLLCIGNCNDREATLNPFLFYQGANQYVKASWNEVMIDSPFRTLIDSSLESVLVHPRTHVVNLDNEVKVNNVYSSKPQYNDGYWLIEKGNGVVLKNIVDYVKDCNRECNVEVKLDNITKYVHLLVTSSGILYHDIFFDKEFPKCPPHITYKDICFNRCDIDDFYKPSCWNYDGDIFSAFKNYYPPNILAYGQQTLSSRT